MLFHLRSLRQCLNGVNTTFITANQSYGEQRNSCFLTAAICLVTGTAFPEACHIVPFAWNSNDTNIAATRALIMGSCKLLEDPDVLYNHLGQHLGSSDKDWNPRYWIGIWCLTSDRRSFTKI